MNQSLRTVLVVASSAIAIPYTLALLTNMLYGWPRKGRYKRALHPRKVYALNYALIKELAKIRYLGLLLKWKYFYSSADQDRLVKNICFGMNANCLDVYLPKDEHGCTIEGSKPVVIFVYGGTWSSGDKSMYGLLCAQLADRLRAVVCCPNYSRYPQGYVDDMVQDVVDSLTWVYHNAHLYGGDRERVMLIGHSAGAHLCVMAVLELVMKRLLHDPQAVGKLEPPVAMSRQSSTHTDGILFEERHFGGSTASSGGESGEESGAGDGTATKHRPSGSFYVVHTDNSSVQSKLATESFYMVDESNSDTKDSTEAGEGDRESSETESKGEDEGSKVEAPRTDNRTSKDLKPTGEVEAPRLEIHRIPTNESSLSRSQKEVRDILASVKLVVGLAGVYHVGEHYKFETWRGVEDVSSMHNAMYSPDRFDQFSPTCIIDSLPRNTWLPPIHLVHGKSDTTVPTSSSTRLSEAINDLGVHTTRISLVPRLGHHDVAMDLMEPTRPWYHLVMGEILASAERFL